jgi:ubiquitin C-terminal hydrolase
MLQVAQEYWQGYLKRNQSVIIDLFGAQLCNTLTYQCGRTSVRRLFVSCFILILPLMS